MREHHYNKENPRTEKQTLNMSTADRLLVREAAALYGWGFIIAAFVEVCRQLKESVNHEKA